MLARIECQGVGGCRACHRLRNDARERRLLPLAPDKADKISEHRIKNLNFLSVFIFVRHGLRRCAIVHLRTCSSLPPKYVRIEEPKRFIHIFNESCRCELDTGHVRRFDCGMIPRHEERGFQGDEREERHMNPVPLQEGRLLTPRRQCDKAVGCQR